MRYMAEPMSLAKPAATFAEFCYIMWGLVLVYNKQVKLLFGKFHCNTPVIYKISVKQKFSYN